ncbi:MAG: FAD binding domain-containing protein [Pseudomonadota bacterium]
MLNFAYARPDSLEAARALMRETDGAAFIAGGTDMLNRIRDGVDAPDILVDISRLDLDGIDFDDARLSIRAMARNTAIAADDRVRRHFPLIADAIEAGASPQVRNFASAAGNILQATRCPYFRDAASPCNRRDPGSGCSAIAGESRKLGILGVSAFCIATHGSDLAVALAALDAQVITMPTSGGRRVLPIAELHRLPEGTPEAVTNLEPGEMILRIEVPRVSADLRSAYVKTRDRASFGYALVSAGVALDVADGRVRSARIALGGVAPRPWRATAAEEALRGVSPSGDAIRAAAALSTAGATPTDDNRFKIDLTRRVVERALAEALA